MIVFQIVEWLASFFEIILGLSFNEKIVSDNELNFKYNAIASFFLTWFIWGINQYKIFSGIAIFIGILGIAIATRLICKVNILDAIIITILWVLLILLTDLLSVSLLGVIFKNQFIAIQVVDSFSVTRLYYIIQCKLILLLMYLGLSRKISIKVQLPIRKMFIGIILNVGVIFYFGNYTFAKVSIEILYIWILIFVSILLGLYSGMQYILYLKEKNQMKVIIERNQILSNHYMEIIKKYQNERIFYHDLENQHLIIGNYLKEKEYELAEQYMRKLVDLDFNIKPIKRTGILGLDILLECKYNEANTHNIFMSIKAEMIQLKLSEQEIISLMGNAIDNALDACRMIKDGKKWIEIVVQRKKDMTLFKISNSYIYMNLL